MDCYEHTFRIRCRHLDIKEQSENADQSVNILKSTFGCSKRDK